MRRENDAVNSPSHYTQGGIECIDAIEAAIGTHADPVGAFLTGQTIKYCWRWPFKGKPIEDLKKARFYLDRLIQYLEAKAYLQSPKPDTASSSTSSAASDAYQRMKQDYEERVKAHDE